MFGTYLRRELVGRRKQTIIVAIGMALAIALVIVVNSVSVGVRDAQSAVLASVYGVGTDITVVMTPEPPAEGEAGGGGPGGGGPFEFGADDGTATDDGTTTVSQSRLSAGRGSSTFDESALDTVLATDHVAAAAATLSLTNTTFDGELPDASGAQPPGEGGSGGGGSSFDVDSSTVLGLDPAGSSVGPLADVTLEEGRSLDSGDTGEYVAVLDAAYATSEGIAVGDAIDIGGTDVEVVGIVASASAEATTTANVYLPLDVAQSLAGLDGQVSTISVQAASSTAIAQVKADIEAELTDATVSTQEDLASSVSGSLASASGLVSGLGLWLSILVLVAAFILAVLFTISGVSRRTKEFGTLKAMGWSNSRIVGQVAGESTMQALIGGVLGIVVGLLAVVVINLSGITLAGSATSTSPGGAGGRRGGESGFGGAAESAAATTDVILSAPVTPLVIVLAAGIAITGGLIAGAFGGWRASRLRPAEALRSVS